MEVAPGVLHMYNNASEILVSSQVERTDVL